jgi:hypothetical protein
MPGSTSFKPQRTTVAQAPMGSADRHDAVGRSEQLEIAHVGIVGGEEGADVARDPVTIRQAAAQPGTSIAIL